MSEAQRMRTLLQPPSPVLLPSPFLSDFSIFSKTIRY